MADHGIPPVPLDRWQPLQCIKFATTAHLFPTLNELACDQLASLFVSRELHEAECAAVEVPNLQVSMQGLQQDAQTAAA